MKLFVHWLILLFLPILGTLAQIPRNVDGLFEYRQTVQVATEKASMLPAKAKEFFRQPFIIHWDTVYNGSDKGLVKVLGRGYIEIRVRHWRAARVIPVALQFELTTSGDKYQYAINQFSGRYPGSNQLFPLEEKPEGVKTPAYDLLLNRTHRYIMSVINMLKQGMDN